jgi:hypothetical protein
MTAFPSFMVTGVMPTGGINLAIALPSVSTNKKQGVVSPLAYLNQFNSICSKI